LAKTKLDVEKEKQINSELIQQKEAMQNQIEFLDHQIQNKEK
jgi:hypothetical protein